MKKEKILWVVMTMFLMVAGVATSCSDDKESPDNNVSYYDGTYSGQKLEAIVDGQVVEGMTVSVKVSGEQAQIRVYGYPLASQEYTWTSECKAEISVQPQMHGEYTSPSGEKYKYEISMSGMYSDTHCKLVCQRAND